MLSFFSLSSEKLQETRSAKDAATLKMLYFAGFLFTLNIAINILHFQINEVLSFQYRNFSNGNLPPFGTFRGQKRPFLSQGQPITSYFQGHNFQCSMNILAQGSSTLMSTKVVTPFQQSFYFLLMDFSRTCILVTLCPFNVPEKRIIPGIALLCSLIYVAIATSYYAEILK